MLSIPINSKLGIILALMTVGVVAAYLGGMWILITFVTPLLTPFFRQMTQEQFIAMMVVLLAVLLSLSALGSYRPHW